MRQSGIKIILVLFATLLFAPLTWAQKVYVIDHLAIGLHDSKQLDSTIIRVLPTGTTLQVLIREDAFVKVKTDDGIEGWVDATYVMDEKPAQLALLELEARFVDRRNELEVARAQVESLSIKLESMRSAEVGLVSNEAATSETLREMQRLAEENQTLLTELQTAKIAAREAEDRIVRGADTSVSTQDFTVMFSNAGFLGLGKWHWIMVGALMVLAFGLGGYLVDWGIRRRHGGFRI